MRRLLIFAAAFGIQTAHAHPTQRQSLAQISAALELEPSQLHLHLNRAEHLLQLRQYEQALQSVTTSRLHTVRAHRLAAEALVGLDKIDAAREHLNQALRRSPTDVAALWLRADLAERQGNLSRARADLMTLVQHNPGSTPGTYLRLAGMQSWESAKSTLQLGLNRTHAQVLRQALVQAALMAGDNNLALRQAAQLVQAAPNATTALLLRAQAYEGLQMKTKAQADLNAALVQAESSVRLRKSPAALARRAQVLAALGDHDGARRDARAALRRAPGLKSALKVLAGGVK